MMRLVEMIRDAVFGTVKDRRGGVATFMAATIVPLIAFAGLAIDTSRGYLMKARMSSALDAAALAGGRAMYNPTLRDEMVQRFFDANFPNNYMGATITGPTITLITVNTTNDTISLAASATMETTLMRVLGLGSMQVAGDSQVTLSEMDVEVALVVDITGSMAGTPLADLKTAAKELVNIIVRPVQTPFYSRVALVPYAMGVNVGSYADAVRGPISGPLKNITAASKTNPVVITAASHGFTDGQTVFIRDVSGMTDINNREFTVAGATANTFQLSGVSGTGYDTYTSGGTAGRMCWGTGCQYQKFDADTNSDRMYQASSCVTERTGVNKFTDVAPSTAYVGWAYPNYPGEWSTTLISQRNPCPANPIVPLTSNIPALENAIDALTAQGSTAGHIGVEWGWYMVSPNFGYLWPATENVPAPYGTSNLLKVAIIMTDGDFNTAFASGIVAKNSTSGSGSSDYKIEANATNASTHAGKSSSYSQALNLCSAMRAAGLLIYTVGFNIDPGSDAEEVVQGCATDPTYVYLADGGTELSEAFQAIAINVSQLRLSK